MSSQTTESTIEVDYTLVSKKKNNNRKKNNSSDSETNGGSESNKKAAISELQPVILKNNDAKPLAFFNPIAIDFGLRQAIGRYQTCKPLKNGNLLVKCETVTQVNALLLITHLNLQTGIKIPVTASTLPQPDSKCIIRNVPLQINEEEILDCLKQIKVKFVKRLTFKNSSNEMTAGKTVLLHFDSCVAAEVVRLGYLNFETKLYIPKPLRCFKCNRFGHVSANCKCNVRCTTCAQNHKTKSCTETVLKCSNCGGEHSAASRQCPRYAMILG